MSRFRALIAVALTLSAANARGDVPAAETEACLPEVRRTILPWEDGRWTVADIRQVSGRVIVLSPEVGREIDQDEASRLAMFQGVTAYHRTAGIRAIQTPVSGFLSAVFILKSDGKSAIWIRYRSGNQVRHRAWPVKDGDELRRIREYIAHFSEDKRGEGGSVGLSQALLDTAYPQYTDEKVTFEVITSRFRLSERKPGWMTTRDGSRVQGSLLPVLDSGQIPVETDEGLRRIALEDVARLAVSGRGASGVLRRSVWLGVATASAGVLMGTVAGLWDTDASIWDYVRLTVPVMGAVGVVRGFVEGLRFAGNREFVMGPGPID